MKGALLAVLAIVTVSNHVRAHSRQFFCAEQATSWPLTLPCPGYSFHDAPISEVVTSTAIVVVPFGLTDFIQRHRVSMVYVLYDGEPEPRQGFALRNRYGCRSLQTRGTQEGSLFNLGHASGTVVSGPLPARGGSENDTPWWIF